MSVTDELATIIDFIRYGASRFSAAGLTFGHSHDNPIDEATHLVLASVHLPPDIPPAYGAGRLTQAERTHILDLIERRITERLPVAYLVGETWFAGMKFKRPPCPGAAFTHRRTDRKCIRALARWSPGGPRFGYVHGFGLHWHRNVGVQPGVAGRYRGYQPGSVIAGA